MASALMRTEPVLGQNPQKSSSLYNWVSNDSWRAAGEGANPSCYSSLPKSSLGPLIPRQRGTRGFVLAILSQHSSFSWAWSPPESLGDLWTRGRRAQRARQGLRTTATSRCWERKGRKATWRRNHLHFDYIFHPNLLNLIICATTGCTVQVQPSWRRICTAKMLNSL